MTVRYRGPVAAKQAKIISPTQLCLLIGMKCLRCCVLFLPTVVVLWITVKHLPLWSWLSNCSRNFVVCSDPTLQICAMLPCPFQKEEAFSGNPSKQPHLFSLGLIVLSALTVNMLTEACRVWAVAFGLFCCFSEDCTLWPWSEFSVMSTLFKIVALC